jgi:hypothetical protein
MKASVSRNLSLVFLLLAIMLPVWAQVPTGALRGAVVDPSKAVISGATVVVKNKATGAERKTTSKEDGEFLVNNLLPGEYEIKVSATGFKSSLLSVTIQVGDTAATEIALEVGAQSETVVVSGDSTAVVNTSDFKVDGVITRAKIENLPLNGRNFLTLAALEPGVRISTSNPGDANSLVNVSVGGADSDLTRITVDGGSVVDYTTGGSGQNFSVESVQEFQISSFNFDLSTGVTSVGAVNIVTRTGTNGLHGSAFAYYRDNNIAAYPVLKRDPLNPDPAFRRLQSGFSLGGPIIKDKLHWFTNLENLNQDSVFSTIHTGYRIPGTTAFPLSQFDTVTGSPFDQWLSNARLDYRPADKHSFFVRYSGDVSKAFAPVSSNPPLPSNWRANKNNSFQGQGGWTWLPSSKVTNDLRLNWQYVGNKSLLPTASDCPSCLGLNGPLITINNSNFVIGNQPSAPQNRSQFRYEATDNVNWVFSKHLIQFGGTYEWDFGNGNWAFLDPAYIVVHDPADILQVNGFIDSLVANPLTGPLIRPVADQLRIPLPAAFTTPGRQITYQDILQLPVAGAAVGIGDPKQPPPFNFGKASHGTRLRFYGQDTWRAARGLSLKYGLSWTYESNLWNHDLKKPALLASLYGTTEPNPRDTNNFAPALGFAWDVKNNQKTVVRGGFSMFYDTSLFVNRLTERALTGPLGNGRVQAPGDFFQSTAQFAQLPATFPPQIVQAAQALRNIAQSLPPGSADRAQLEQAAALLPALLLINVAPGTPINFQVIPTKYTAANFLTDINRQIPVIQQQLSALGSQGVTGLDFFKSASGNGVLISPDTKIPYSLQYSIGAQRELPWNMLLSTDLVFRRRVHTFFQVDRNLFNRAASLGGPMIPRCSAANATNPIVRCTNGPVEVLDGAGRETYKALLVKLDKRFSRRYQFTAAYTLSSLTGYDYGRDLANWFGNHGPLGADARHTLSFNGRVDLPWDFQIDLITLLSSRGTFSATLPGTANSDINGDGTNNDLLPGFRWNQGNRDISESDLRALADAYNTNFAGKTAPRGGTFPTVNLPASFAFGDAFQTYDVRFSKNIQLFREKYKLELIATVFNIFNVSNLQGFNGRLNDSFGQPTAKAGQAFGYGGPRAWEFAARFKF